jgi:hypothetical protein
LDNLVHFARANLHAVTAAAEVVGQLALGRGLTSQFRPRQYFTFPKASLERFLDDMEQFINFFVIESQRIVFAENVYATVAVSGTFEAVRSDDLALTHHRPFLLR